MLFDSDPASQTFGRILLTPFGSDLDGLSEAESDSLTEGFAVWQGEVGLDPDGCVALDGQPSLLGDHKRTTEGLEFVPRFPLRFGTTYTACADLDFLDQLQPAAFEGTPEAVLRVTVLIPARQTAGTVPRVSSVWPAEQSVPANLLRIYVHFDQPMERRGVASKIDLLDDGGLVIDDAFVEIPDGLWDDQSKRLTLFLHPGRIKRGVGPNQRMGPVLREGQSVVLRIDGSLAAAGGGTLGHSHERSYQVIAADRTSPAVEQWSMEVPSRPDDPLRVFFGEILDREQLLSLATVWRDRIDSPDGASPVDGRTKVALDGRSWEFLPAEPWQEGRYRLLIRPDIEDLAGNRPGRLFDFETEGLPDAEQSAPLAVSGGEEAELERGFEILFEG